MRDMDEKLYKVLYWLCSIAMLSMMFLIFFQVVARYALNNSLTWSEELGRYLFIWMSFLGMAAAVKMKSHVALDVIFGYISKGTARYLRMFNSMLIALLGIAIVYSGSAMMEVGMFQTSASLKIPMHIIYVVMPISGILMLYFAVIEAIRAYRRVDEQKGGNG